MENNEYCIKPLVEVVTIVVNRVETKKIRDIQNTHILEKDNK